MSSSLPDFLIIGRAKCGTTTLATWLSEQPDVYFSPVKEARFFVPGRTETKGIDWYSGLFRGAAPGQVLGEGTPGYSAAGISAYAAQRIRELIPAVRLVYMVRHPEERIRSDYRHRRIVGNEFRTLGRALADAAGPYIPHTMYYRCLEPYIELFDRDQILVIRTEDLTQDGSAWPAVLRHIGLPDRPAPDTTHNVSAERGFYRAPLRFLRTQQVRQRYYWVPRRVRQLVKRVGRKRGEEFDSMLEDSRSAIPSGLLDEVWEDVGRLEDWLGAREPLWPRAASLKSS